MSDPFMDAIERLHMQREAELAREASRLARAILLSPSIDVAEALLNGESVPLDRLDPPWLRRYGLKRLAE